MSLEWTQGLEMTLERTGLQDIPSYSTKTPEETCMAAMTGHLGMMLGHGGHLACGLACNAACIFTGMRTGIVLGAADGGREAYFRADLSDVNVGSVNVGFPPFTFTGKHRMAGMERTIGAVCGGNLRGVNWQGQVCFRGGCMRKILLYLNYFFFKILTI